VCVCCVFCVLLLVIGRGVLFPSSLPWLSPSHQTGFPSRGSLDLQRKILLLLVSHLRESETDFEDVLSSTTSSHASGSFRTLTVPFKSSVRILYPVLFITANESQSIF
jgi:hypothetical protein